MVIGMKSALAWPELEGQIVDGGFPLLKCLSSTGRSAVFSTERPKGEPRNAAIKLLALDEKNAEAQLARWKESALLLHPHLVRLFEMGRAWVDDISCAYVLMEYAEEDLSKVDRALTLPEANDVLAAALKVLTSLHAKGLAHGHLRTSNIMAVADRIKISSDTIRPIGEWRSGLDVPGESDPPEIVDHGASPAADVWSLGVTLVNALTMQPPSWDAGAAEATLPDTLPAQFRLPLANCLRRDPKQRWTVAELASHLHGSAENPAGPHSQSSHAKSPARSLTRRYLLAAGAVGLALAAAAIIVPRLSRPHTAPETRVVESARSRSEPPVTQAPEDASRKTAVPATRGKTVRQDILKKVLPRVPAKASNTIHGKVIVNIRIAVDANGSVIDATNESPDSSRYFGNLALQAARQWKFAPIEANSVAGLNARILRFQFVNDPSNPVSVQPLPSN